MDMVPALPELPFAEPPLAPRAGAAVICTAAEGLAGRDSDRLLRGVVLALLGFSSGKASLPCRDAVRAGGELPCRLPAQAPPGELPGALSCWPVLGTGWKPCR